MLLVRYQQLQFVFWKKSLSWSLLTADPEGTSSQFLTFLLLLPEPTPGSASYANAGTFYMNFLEQIPLWWYQSFSAPSNTTFSAPCHNTQGARSDPVLWVAIRLQATPDRDKPPCAPLALTRAIGACYCSTARFCHVRAFQERHLQDSNYELF